MEIVKNQWMNHAWFYAANVFQRQTSIGNSLFIHIFNLYILYIIALYIYLDKIYTSSFHLKNSHQTTVLIFVQYFVTAVLNMMNRWRIVNFWWPWCPVPSAVEKRLLVLLPHHDKPYWRWTDDSPCAAYTRHKRNEVRCASVLPRYNGDCQDIMVEIQNHCAAGYSHRQAPYNKQR